MTVLVFGATGMVGIEVLHLCLEDARVDEVVSVGRRSTGVSHAKLIEIEHSDYTDYSAVEHHFEDVDVCIYCIGVYQGKVTPEMFSIFTCDYLEALVLTLERVNENVTFCLFSAQGADRSTKSRMLFAREKGRAENILFASNLEKCYAFRPGYIDPGRRSAKSRIPLRLVRPFFIILPFIGIKAADLAAVMLEVGLTGSDLPIYENADLRRSSAEL